MILYQLIPNPKGNPTFKTNSTIQFNQKLSH